MNEFRYFEMNNDAANDYILLTCTEDAYFLYDAMYSQLSRRKGEHFNVVLDLVLRNGFAFNRFILLEFNAGKVKSRIINPREVPEEIKKNTKLFLQKNKELLFDSTLTTSMISFIMSD